MDVVLHVYGLAVAVAANDDVLDVVRDTCKLKHRMLCGHAVYRHEGTEKMLCRDNKATLILIKQEFTYEAPCCPRFL